MIVERTFDVKVCLDILTDSHIFDAISEDTATMENLRVNVIDEYWLKIEVDSQIIGVVQFKQMFNKCFDSHIHILKDHRRKHSIEAGRLILKWCNDNMKDSLLYTNVPCFCNNVKDFLINFGFKEQGVLPNAWRKNGEMNDMTILTRGV